MSRLILTFLALSPVPALAQHDPQRNATQAIASGKLAVADRIKITAN